MSAETEAAAAPVARRWAAAAVSTERLDRVAAERALRALGMLAELELPERRIWVESPDAAATVARREGLGEPWGREWLTPVVVPHRAGERGDAWDAAFCDLTFCGVPHPRIWAEREPDAVLVPTIVGSGLTWLAAMLELIGDSGIAPTVAGRVLQLAAESLHAVWVFDDAVVLCERPTVVRLDERARLHAVDGPALEYADGPDAFAWHGRRVPPWAVLAPASPRLLGDEEPRVKSIAIERAGWPEVIRALGMPTLGECADPGNPGRTLRLHRMPPRLADQLYGRPAHVLLMTNGSPARDGSLAAFAEVVPGDIRSPLDAAAWQYGVEPDVYAQLARRT